MYVVARSDFSGGAFRCGGAGALISFGEPGGGCDGLNGKLFAPPPCGVTESPRGQKVTCSPGECVAALLTQNNG